MFIGHYGPAFAARAAGPRVPLGVGFVAVQLLDVLFSAFLVLGVERMRIVPGFTAVNGYDLVSMPYTHSLVGALAWSALAALAWRALRRSWREAGVVGALVLSHFVLDVPVHLPDLTLAGDDTYKLGLGLWRSRWATMALELASLGTGVWLWRRGRRPSARAYGFVALLAALAVATPFLPPPPSVTVFAVQAAVSYVALALAAWWVDRGADAPA